MSVVGRVSVFGLGDASVRGPQKKYCRIRLGSIFGVYHIFLKFNSAKNPEALGTEFMVIYNTVPVDL